MPDQCQRHPKSRTPFYSKANLRGVSSGGPSLTLPCLSRVTIPPLPCCPCSTVSVPLCICASVQGWPLPFPETPRYLSDSGRFSLSSTNGRRLTLIKFVQWDLVLLNKWMGAIFPSNPIEIHFILQFPWKSVLKRFKCNVCFSWKSCDGCFLEFSHYMHK